MARGKQTHPRIKELVRIEYATNNNLSETARIFGLGVATVKAIVEEEPDKLEEYRKQKTKEFINDAAEWKQEFLKRAEQSINKAIELSQQRIELALVSHEQFNDRIDKIIELLNGQGADYHTISEMVKVLSSVMNVPLKDLSTYIGTIYDKRALANGDPTSRSDNMNKHIGELNLNVTKLEDFFR